MSNLFKFGGQGRNSIIYIRVDGYTNFRPLKQKVEKAKSRNFRRAGAIIRGIMKRLIRHRKNPRLASPVGTPPYAHFLPGIKNTIQFVSSPKNVIVGPQINRNKPNISPVPGALEYGGTTLVRSFRKKSKRKAARVTKKGGQWINGKFYKRGSFRPHASKSGKPVPQWWLKKNPLPHNPKVRAQIRPRPFANPALKIFVNSPQYDSLWKDCVK